MKDLFLSDRACKHIAELLKDDNSEDAREFLRKLNKLTEQENAEKYMPFFYGHRVSDYAMEHGRLDYATMAKCFDAVLCNNIYEADENIYDDVVSGDFDEYYYDGEQISRDEYEEAMEKLDEQLSEIDDAIAELEDEEGEQAEHLNNRRDELEAERDKYEQNSAEIFQYFIVSDNALHLLQEAHELVFYSNKLDVYIWAVCHWGTSWDYVLTSIKLEPKSMGDE